MRTLSHISSVFVTLLLGLSLCGCGGKTVVVADGQQANVITVNASSEVKVVPDKASFTVEVLSRAETAKEAQDQGGKVADAVLAAILAAGVEEKNVQTSYSNLSPVYDWTNNEPNITGYEQRTGLEVRDVDINAVSGLMQTCVSAGASSVSGPNYYASKYDEAYEQALTEAISSSRDKATAMAEAAGVKLGEVVAIEEGYQSSAYLSNGTTVALGQAEDVDMKIAPGEVNVEAQVTVTFGIN